MTKTYKIELANGIEDTFVDIDELTTYLSDVGLFVEPNAHVYGIDATIKSSGKVLCYEDETSEYPEAKITKIN